MLGGSMQRLYARLSYELIEIEIFKRLDGDEGRVSNSQIEEIVLIAFYKVAILFCLSAEQVMECCTLRLGYTLEEFIDSVKRCITGQDSELVKRIETRLS
jgi:hypothetical protein